MDVMRLRMASLAATLCLAGAPAALPGAAAAPCPASQTFSGTLLPWEVDTIAVTVPVRGNVSFQFIPAWPFWDPLGQEVTMSLKGNRVTGTGSLAFFVVQAAPGLYTVRLEGHHLEDETHIDGLAALTYQLKVVERNCQAA